MLPAPSNNEPDETGQAETRIPTWWTLAALLAAAFFLRLFLTPYGGYRYDLHTMAQWSGHLYHDGLFDFYGVAKDAAHLPGDLWLLYGLAHLFGLLNPILDSTDFHGSTYLTFLKVVPAIADVLVSLMLFRTLGMLRNARVGLIAAAAYAFNPAPIFITSIWGNWNAIVAVLMLVSIDLVLRKRWIWAVPVWVWMLLVKPQLGLLIPLMLIKPVRDNLLPGVNPVENCRHLFHQLGTNLAIAALLAINTLLLLILPFNVGLPGINMRWSLANRIDFSVDIYDLITMRAFNLWQFIVGNEARKPDTEVFIFGLDARSWGLLLIIGVYGAVAVITWRKWSTVDHATILVWAALCTTTAAFVLPTRIHSRYLFPALVLSILLAGLWRRGWWLAAGLTITFMCNNVFVYTLNNPTRIDGLLPLMASQEFQRAVSLANILLLGVMLSIWKHLPVHEPLNTESQLPLPSRAEHHLASVSGDR